MSSPFLRGLTTGAQLGAAYKGAQRQEKLDARADEEYETQKRFNEAWQQEQKDYYTGNGAYASKPANPDPAAVEKSDASYAQAENRRFGIQTPEADPAAPPTPGLSLSPAESKSLQPVAMDPLAKDKLYFQRLRQLSEATLPPEKSLLYREKLDKLEETGFNRQRLDAFRLASRGDPRGLDWIKSNYKDQYPNGWELDTSEARHVPGEGWVGVKHVNVKTGESQPVKLGPKEMAFAYGESDPAKVAALQLAFNQDRRADGAEQRQVADSEARIRQADQRWALDVARFAQEVEQNAHTRKYQLGTLSLSEQRLNLEQKKFDNDENAKDLLTRQSMFINSFGANRKLGDMPSDAERAEASAKEQAAALATSLYGTSTEKAKPEERNAIASEVQQFVLGLDAGTLDLSKVVRGPDGMATYGRVRFPASMLPPQATDKPTAPPKRKPGLAVPSGSSEEYPSDAAGLLNRGF